VRGETPRSKKAVEDEKGVPSSRFLSKARGASNHGRIIKGLADGRVGKEEEKARKGRRERGQKSLGKARKKKGDLSQQQKQSVGVTRRKTKKTMGHKKNETAGKRRTAGPPATRAQKIAQPILKTRKRNREDSLCHRVGNLKSSEERYSIGGRGEKTYK